MNWFTQYTYFHLRFDTETIDEHTELNTKKIKRRHTSSGSVSVCGSSLKSEKKKCTSRAFPKVYRKENPHTNSFLEEDIDSSGMAAFWVTKKVLFSVYFIFIDGIASPLHSNHKYRATNNIEGITPSSHSNHQYRATNRIEGYYYCIYSSCNSQLI